MPDSLVVTQKAVKRSRESWFGKIFRLFDQVKVESEVWDALEELLIAADVGVATTQKLIEKVKQRVKAEKLNEPAKVRRALEEEMISLLTVELETAAVTDSVSLYAILVVGVNGSGKANR